MDPNNPSGVVYDEKGNAWFPDVYPSFYHVAMMAGFFVVLFIVIGTVEQVVAWRKRRKALDE